MMPKKMCGILKKEFRINEEENNISEYDYEEYDARIDECKFYDSSYGLYFDKDANTVLYIHISEYDLSMVCFNEKHTISYTNYSNISTDYFSYDAFYNKSQDGYEYDDAILLESFFEYTTFPTYGTTKKIILYGKNYKGTLLNYIQKRTLIYI